MSDVTVHDVCSFDLAEMDEDVDSTVCASVQCFRARF